MNTGEETFVEIEEKEPTKEQPKKYGRDFSIGELIEIKKSLFKVVKITPKKLTLRLLKHLG